MLHQAVVAGLIISAGGLTESVVKAANSAVAQWARVVRQLKAYAPLVRLSRTLLGLFDVRFPTRGIMPCTFVRTTY